MAKAAPKKEEAAVESAPAPNKGKKKLILIAVVAVLVLAIGGAAAMMMLKKKHAAADGAEEEVATEEHHEGKGFDPKKPPVFVPLEPFTVNLQPENGEQFLQVVATLRVEDEKIGEQVKVFMPQIRHEMLSLLSGKHASEITSPEGREELAADMKETVNEILGWEPPKKKKKNAPDPEGPVIGVFFTQFIVQ